MSCDQERLQATLGRSELARLLQRLRARLERGNPLTGTISLPDASPAERDALARLLGRMPTRGNSLAISLERLEETLRAAGVCPSLRAGVEQLTGPITNLRDAREAAEREWDELFAQACQRVADRPGLKAWLDQLRATGLLRRHGVQDASLLLSQVLATLAVLPAQDIPLAELAASALGDAHALDPDRTLSSLVLRAAFALGQCGRFDDTHSRREAWASLGVICDELSAPVLVLNLRASGESFTARVLNIHSDSGEPAFLTVRQQLHNDLAFTREQVGGVVYVCENPSVVAAAARRLGPASRPLVCIEGQPRTATRLLLRRLQEAAVELRYHGDFDWPGIQIANTILERHGALPWRMGTADYRVAATGSLLLTGTPLVASWDDQLMPAMRELGVAVHEEQVADWLLADLAG